MSRQRYDPGRRKRLAPLTTEARTREAGTPYPEEGAPLMKHPHITHAEAEAQAHPLPLEDQITYWKARSRALERAAQRAQTHPRPEDAAPETAPTPTGPDPVQLEVLEARMEAAATRRGIDPVPLLPYLRAEPFMNEDGRVERAAVETFFQQLADARDARTVRP